MKNGKKTKGARFYLVRDLAAEMRKRKLRLRSPAAIRRAVKEGRLISTGLSIGQRVHVWNEEDAQSAIESEKRRDADIRSRQQAYRRPRPRL